MKIVVSTPHIEAVVLNDNSETVYSFSADNYEVVINTEAGAKAVQEIITQLKALAEQL